MVFILKPGGQGIVGQPTTPPAPDFVIQVPVSQLPTTNTPLVPGQQAAGPFLISPAMETHGVDAAVAEAVSYAAKADGTDLPYSANWDWWEDMKRALEETRRDIEEWWEDARKQGEKNSMAPTPWERVYHGVPFMPVPGTGRLPTKADLDNLAESFHHLLSRLKEIFG